MITDSKNKTELATQQKEEGKFLVVRGYWMKEKNWQKEKEFNDGNLRELQVKNREKEN